MIAQREKKNELPDSIALIDRLTQQTTFKALMRTYNRTINKFFDCEYISCMFHDPEKNQLYTITFGDEEDI